MGVSAKLHAPAALSRYSLEHEAG